MRARTEGLTAADVDRALTEDRTLLITWLNRGTLHLVRSEDYPWLQALTTPPLLTGNATRLRQEGVGPDEAERAVTVIERALAEDGPLTRFQLRDHLDAAGVPTAGQAFVHLRCSPACAGSRCAGRWSASSTPTPWSATGSAPPPAVDREAALAELARRYLAGHGPAGDRDLAQVGGPAAARRPRRPRGRSQPSSRRRGMATVRLRGRRRRPAAMPPPRLLGAFDPTLLGWTSREEIVGEHGSRIVSGGVFRPFALVGGRAVAIWKWADGKVELDPFEDISGSASKLARARGRRRRPLSCRSERIR